MLDECWDNRPVFVCLPDIVGDARRTLDFFEVFKRRTNGLPRALVLQDGIGRYPIPWDDIDAVFVGGSDVFKLSGECVNACKTAKMLGKWVHVGRVNSVERLISVKSFCDSIDGSGISRYTHMLEKIIGYLSKDIEQMSLEL